VRGVDIAGFFWRWCINSDRRRSGSASRVFRRARRRWQAGVSLLVVKRKLERPRLLQTAGYWKKREEEEEEQRRCGS
jgi:hypothetical protein